MTGNLCVGDLTDRLDGLPVDDELIRLVLDTDPAKLGRYDSAARLGAINRIVAAFGSAACAGLGLTGIGIGRLADTTARRIGGRDVAGRPVRGGVRAGLLAATHEGYCGDGTDDHGEDDDAGEHDQAGSPTGAPLGDGVIGTPDIGNADDDTDRVGGPDVGKAAGEIGAATGRPPAEGRRGLQHDG